MKNWEVTINGFRWTVKASNSWTAVTRCIKSYQKYKREQGMTPRFWRLSIEVNVEEEKK